MPGPGACPRKRIRNCVWSSKRRLLDQSPKSIDRRSRRRDSSPTYPHGDQNKKCGYCGGPHTPTVSAGSALRVVIAVPCAAFFITSPQSAGEAASRIETADYSYAANRLPVDVSDSSIDSRLTMLQHGSPVYMSADSAPAGRHRCAYKCNTAAAPAQCFGRLIPEPRSLQWVSAKHDPSALICLPSTDLQSGY